MIIGVNGYAGSGKDTVGAIIQYIFAHHYNPLALPVETMVTDLDEYGQFLEENSGWEIRKFAGKLKDIASHLTGIEVENFEDQEFKKTDLGPEWGMTVRDLLQKLGTDAMRTGLHTNVWVNALMADYQCVPADLAPNGWDCDNWIITDTRFENEAQAIKDIGGIIIRIDRPGVHPINDHSSEIGLDHWDFDHKIVNLSDIVDLTQTVRSILKHNNLL